MYKILLVDDEFETLKDRSQIISELGYECKTAIDGAEAIDKVNREPFDVVLTDVKMPKKDGFEVLKRTQSVDPDIPVILFTAFATIESAVKAMKMGAHDYIQKPFSPEMIEVVLSRAIDYRKLRKENILLRSQIKEQNQLKNVIGRSTAITEVVNRAIKVAKTDASVLVYGESGTGKELIARSIHANSYRSNTAFIPLDCVALPATLLESEIFGYEQGAFTGAVRSKPGMMELANKGTLFLDEIAELDVNLQAKLLRVLQEKQFRRIGGQHLIDVDVRIISATSWNPEIAVKQNRLRQDLYYRLNVVPIFMPPLRERREDILLLAKHFIEKLNPSTHKNIKGISKRALQYLRNYDWPGNVRELQNVIENAMSMTENDIIEIEDLNDHIKVTSDHIPMESLRQMDFKEAKREYLHHFCVQYINNMLEKYDGNISKVARIAGVSRRTIYRILDKEEHQHQ